MVEIISRARWGARHPNGFGNAPLPASEVWLHHSVTLAPDISWIDTDRDGVEDDEEKAMRHIEDIGQSRFGGGISYTWLIPPSGRIYEGHSVNRIGSHTGGRNSIARAICLIGNYDINQPTQEQIRSAALLLRFAHQQKWIKFPRLNGGHRDLKATGCPGKFAYSSISLINNYQEPSPPVDRRELDMSVRLQRGDSRSLDPNGTPYGDYTFMVKYDPYLPGGAVRLYMQNGPVYRSLLKAQGGVDVLPQADLDAIPKVDVKSPEPEEPTESPVS